MKEPTLEERIEELLYRGNLSTDELGRLWLMCYTNQEIAWHEDRIPTYDEQTFSAAAAINMKDLEPMEIIKMQADLAQYSYLIEELKKVTALATTHLHTAQTAYYGYMYQVTDELRHQTAVTLSLATPIILSIDEYNELATKAGSSDIEKIAETYRDGLKEGAPLEELDKIEFLYDRARFSGFAVRCQEQPSKIGETLQQLTEPLNDPQILIDGDELRIFFANF